MPRTVGILQLSLIAFALANPAWGQDPPRPGVERGPSGERILYEKVWVPAHDEKVWVQPVYRTETDAAGNEVRVLVEPGHYRIFRHEGHYEFRPVAPAPVVRPARPAARGHYLMNHRSFQIELRSLHVVTSTDEKPVPIVLPKDRVISSHARFGLDLPPNATAILVRFRAFDWANKRFKYPIIERHLPLTQNPESLIH